MKLDGYKEVKTLEFPGVVARVYRPELTEAERERRFQEIHNAAARLLKTMEVKKNEVA